MSTLVKTYGNATAAREAVEALGAEGVPKRDIPTVMGATPHDVRREPVGSFAGTLSPDAPVGTFGDVVRRRWQGAGTFAGEPDRQRQGSFADTDRHVIVLTDVRARREDVAHAA
jgi:hypothetical protein